MILIKTVRRRRLKFKPKLATTMRPHGKWGDLLACLIPISWCINILVNSNFLLKLIEWQNESSLFTLKIRGKQWYWVYKLDFKNFTNIITAPKNVGHNKWVLFGHNNIKQSDDYMSAIQLRKQTNLVKEYWSEVCSKEELVNSPMNSSFYESVTKMTKTKLNNANLNNSGQVYLNAPKLNFNLPSNEVNLQPLNVSYEINANVRLLRSSSLKEARLGTFIKNKLASSEGTGASIWTKELEYLDIPNVISNKNYNVVSSAMFEDNSRFFKRKEGISNPLNIRPIYLSDDSIHEVKNSSLNLLNTRYETGINEIAPKPKPHNNFMVMKQKRYKRRKDIKETKYTLGTKALEYYKTNNIKATPENKGKILLSRDTSLSYIKDEKNNTSRNYKLFMKNKVRGDDTNIAVSRRMIRTKRTLVLPAHVNLTAITNSYDVIHSWFIPGLGLKMDCIPGRSTHHTFYIDNVGFYYGQCAEVCGRYHHHMPIRICALPFNHFLLWWHHFGVPKLLPNNISKKVDITTGLRKYVW
jgi:heme/copper-type cytochrome/quinol oxidase subunit 2